MTGTAEQLLDWAWAGIALEGDTSGDVHVVVELADGALVGVIDGLGHGVEAAAAAQRAARVLEATAGEPLDALLARCHEALRGTRGAVMTLARFDARDRRMTWAGIGNVEALLVRYLPGAATPLREVVSPRGGIVGYRLPTVRAATLPFSPGDMLVMATDGIHDGFVELVTPDRPPQEIADTILARYARGSDDALVLVARVIGARDDLGDAGTGGAA